MALFRARRRRLVAATRAEAEAEHLAHLDASGVVVVRDTSASPAMTHRFGWDHESFRIPGTLRGLVHPDDLAQFDRCADQVTVRLLTADGTHRRVLVVRTPGHDLLVDLHPHQEHLEQTVRHAEVVEHSPHGVVVIEFTDVSDPDSMVLRSANPAARRLLRLEHHSLDGTRLDGILTRPSARLVSSIAFDVAHTGQSLTAERLTFSELPDTWIDVRVDRLADGTLAATFSDVTEQVVTEEGLRHRAGHDGLTGLPNRSVLEDRLAVLTSDLLTGRHVALVLVDVDGLAAVNESLGHRLGDRFVVAVADRLARNVVGAELVARIGSSDFGVVSRPSDTRAEAVERADSVAAALATPVDVDGHLVPVQARIGVAIAPDHGADPRTLVHAAEAALHHARTESTSTESTAAKSTAAESTAAESTGTESTTAGATGAPGVEATPESAPAHVRFFDPASTPPDAPATGLITRLRRGLADQELEVRYQPVVELRTGRVAKVEAVLRWQRSDSRTGPAELLELAEQSGLVRELTRWLFGEAARAARVLAEQGEAVRVCVNLPLVSLANSDLLTFVDLMVTAGELDSDLIELELTEAEVAADAVRAQLVASRATSLGIRLAVDGFGTGYTSAATLGLLNVCGIKIDRSFITTLAAVPADLAAVRSTVELAHELGLTVGAEGVADSASLDLLAGVGCDFAQGFHISGPVTLDALGTRVRELTRAMQGWSAALPSSGDHVPGRLGS